ncbi:MAG: metallophosphoesterase [Trichodesmium sp. ALOHA_ZT_67]|nr:metallophosphoesterase [Trichodesmium sp. ALOHA_ZT_67]MDE5095669.1 metallophosphoesterase [Trichodesmium sp. St11_bin5]MDT9342310.1 metallophosphoesterase [Trichodesmium erythraeum 21-75]
MHRILTGPLQVDRLTLKINGLPQNLQGTKLVQLSDFHYDRKRLSEWLLTRAIAITNKVEPDLILLTGDFITDEPTPVDDLVLRLKDLKSRAGVYAVLGNHDEEYPGARDKVIEAFTRVEIPILLNQVVYPLGSGLALVGLEDYWSANFQPFPVIESINKTVPRIVLSHNPDTAKVLQKWRIDLQLSGHTHGGQIRLPYLGPLAQFREPIRKLIPKFLQPVVPFMGKCEKIVKYWEWSQGLHQIGNNFLYVNRGLGTYFPGRLFCPPEVTIITLVTNY